MIQILIVIIIGAAVATVFFYKKPLKKIKLPEDYKKILSKHVAFYRNLDYAGKIRFEDKIKELLAYIHITGVGTTVDDTDRLLVASSGVIPIFNFPEWKYYNLRDVLLYPDNFNETDFLTKGSGRDVLGMVGDGAMQRMMILSKSALHRGFDNTTGKENTGIHEFIHLLDKEDGAVDGLPEALLDKQYTVPWLRLMSENIAAIKARESDINIYGSKNKAEFFAVASEYFFEQPELFKEKHSDLYNLLTQIFHNKPAPI
jgi:MtfA peptidase